MSSPVYFFKLGEWNILQGLPRHIYWLVGDLVLFDRFSIPTSKLLHLFLHNLLLQFWNFLSFQEISAEYQEPLPVSLQSMIMRWIMCEWQPGGKNQVTSQHTLHCLKGVISQKTWKYKVGLWNSVKWVTLSLMITPILNMSEKCDNIVLWNEKWETHINMIFYLKIYGCSNYY